jgi:hypothetical protein
LAVGPRDRAQIYFPKTHQNTARGSTVWKFAV